MTHEELEKEARDPNRSKYACGDNFCVFGSPGGKATNGGCRCFDGLPRTPDVRTVRRKLTHGILYLRGRVKDLLAAAEPRERELEALRARVAELEAQVERDEELMSRVPAGMLL